MAISQAHVFPGYLTPVLTRTSFQGQRQLFSHASAEVRGENTLERNFASTGTQTHNSQVMHLTFSPLSHPGRAYSNAVPDKWACVITQDVFGSGQNNHSERICYALIC